MENNNQPIMRAVILPGQTAAQKATQKVANYYGERYGSEYSGLVSRSGYHDLDADY